MQSRASERKWESDRDVSSCSDCDKKFSVSVRKVRPVCVYNYTC